MVSMISIQLKPGSQTILNEAVEPSNLVAVDTLHAQGHWQALTANCDQLLQPPRLGPSLPLKAAGHCRAPDEERHSGPL